MQPNVIRLFAVILPLIVLASVRSAEPTGLDALLGTWTVESLSSKAGQKQADGFRMKIDQKRFTVIAPNGNEKVLGEFVQVNEKNSPKEIDLSEKGKTMPGIYELTGDKLKLAISEPSGTRPTEFAGKPGTLYFLLKKSK